MKIINDLVSKLKKSFKSKTYRHAYVDEFLNVSIATQIKVLREQRGWNQEDLAKEAQMKQPRISIMENVNYSSWSINTLKKLAKAFDLVLCVSFESFGNRLKDIDQLNRKALEQPSFEDDPLFAEKEEVTVTGPVIALVEANRELARSNEIPGIDLKPKEPIFVAALQTNPYRRQRNEASFRKASSSHLVN